MFSFLKLKITSFENSGNKTILGDDGMLLVMLVVYYMEEFNSAQFQNRVHLGKFNQFYYSSDYTFDRIVFIS